jgi:hypothetical protein
MKEMMVYVSLSVVALAIFLAIGLCATQTEIAPATTATTIAPLQNRPLYQDSCVTRVIEPEVNLEFIRYEAVSKECPYLCLYLFKIVNKTYNEGTKAYSVQIVLQDKTSNYVTLDNQHIQLITLHGLSSQLSPARFPELRKEGYFVVQAKCPECLGSYESLATFLVDYWDCNGKHQETFRFNLSTL